MQVKVLLVNVYAPNFDDVEFSNRLLGHIPHLNTRLLIFRGDLNCVIDPVLDRSSPCIISLSTMSKSFSDFMTLNGMVDPWRLRNRSSKKFSFFSHVHQSYSRIDYFFIDNTLNPCVVSSDYSSILIFDHAPLFLDRELSMHKSTPPFWRFYSFWQMKHFVTLFLILLMSFSLLIKVTTSYSLLWESLKAFLRGQIISYSSYSNKKQNIRLSELVCFL